MKKTKPTRFRPIGLTLILLFWTILQIQAQTQQGTKISPVKTARINIKDLEKAAVSSPADSLKPKKVENQTKIIPETPLPKGAKIIRHTAPPPEPEKFEIRKKEKGGKDSSQPNFPGLGDNNTSIPPDIGAAAGPNHLMVALNTQVRFQDKTGAILSTVTLDAFFAALGGAPNMFDPKVLYDPFAQRWIITAPANSPASVGGAAPNSSIMVGVSDTNDPTGTWDLYQFDADGANVNWFDYPSIGFNKNWLVVTGNLFSISAWAFQGAQILMFDKAALYAGTATPTVVNRPTSDGFTICPAITLDNTQNTEYLVSSFNSGAGTLRIYTITGTPAAPVYTVTSIFPAAASGWSANPPGDFGPQSGAVQLISNGDRRIQNAVFRNGSLWCAHTIFLPAGGAPNRSAVQWWQIDPVTGTPQQNARIDDNTAVNFFAYPSIAVNAYNDAYIGYSSFSATQFASSNYSFRLHTDALNTLQPTVQYKTGLAKYFKTFGTGTNRWGDYSSSCIDPDDFSLWTIQEYAELPVGTGVNADRWGTEWNKLVPPVPDLYAKDRNEDLGAEPNPSTLPMWESPDIWVRNAADGLLAHQDAEYRTGTSNPNYIYVRVRNRGGAISSGTEQLTVYWAKAGSYLDWLDPWNGGIYFDPGPNTMLMGDVVGTQTIPTIAAGANLILPPFAWNPTNPSLYSSFGTQQNHYCLLARITSSSTAPFGMQFPETNALYANVQNNNNIAWKNISVFDLLPGVQLPGEAVIGNLGKLAMKARFRIEWLDWNGALATLDKGMIKVTPVGKLAEILRKSPLTGEGVKMDKDGAFLISKQGAVLEGLSLNPGDFGVLKISYLPNAGMKQDSGYAIRFTQLEITDSGDRMVGGQTFVYGQVTGYETQPGGKGTGGWPWWSCFLIIFLLGAVVWFWRRKK